METSGLSEEAQLVGRGEDARIRHQKIIWGTSYMFWSDILLPGNVLGSGRYCGIIGRVMNKKDTWRSAPRGIVGVLIW